MKITKIVCFLIVAILSVTALASCTGINNDNTAAQGEALTYIGLRINPEIELLADEAGNVVAANAVNEDGEVILSTVELEGMSVEEAGETFTQTANDLGYLTPDGEKDTVYIDVESTIDGEDARLTEQLTARIRRYFSNKGINGKIAPETLEKYAEKATEWGVSAGHTKLIMRVLDAHPELSDQDVLQMSIKELLQLIKGENGKAKIAVGLKEEYRADIETLRSEYEKLFALREEIDALEAQLTEDLTDEEKAAIETQIAEIQSEMIPLRDAYKTELSELQDSFREASKEVRKAYRAEAERRQNAHKGKSGM